MKMMHEKEKFNNRKTNINYRQPKGRSIQKFKSLIILHTTSIINHKQQPQTSSINSKQQHQLISYKNNKEV